MIGTWIRNLIILALAAYVANDQAHHIWEDGRRWGFQQGYQQGLKQPPQVWKSGT